MFRYYLEKLKCIDYCVKEGSKVLVRIDINAPLDPKTKDILDDYRFQAHAETIKYLVKHGVSVVILAHQGRPGRSDFTSLEKHREVLEKYVGIDVKFIDDVMGPAARKAIKELGPGEVLLLDNVRFVSEEVIERDIEVQANTYLVKKLAPLFDYFIFDGFAVAHRSQPSVVGFPLVLPSCMGLVLEKELRALSEIEKTRDKAVLVVGGAKVLETLRAIEEALSRGVFEEILVGGLVGIVFIVAKYGLISTELRRMLESHGLLSYVDYASRIKEKWGNKVLLPTDVAIEVNGARLDADIYSISSEVLDIGSTTIRNYLNFIKKARVVVFSGPLGYIEKDDFTKGTAMLMKEAVAMGKEVIIGGGHTIALARKLGILKNVSHASTGGRAFLEALVNPNLPALKALEISVKRFWGDGS